MEAFARVGQADKQMVLKFLDIGVSGIMAPQVNTIEQASAAVLGNKYAPLGNRGLAGGRSFDFGAVSPLTDYVGKLNDRVCSIVQFEHVDALADLDAVLALEHLDVLFVGPNDLAQSLGLPGQPNHPEVTKVADEVVARAKAAGVKTGTVAYNLELVENVFSRGFDMAVASATGFFVNAAKAWVTGSRAIR